MRKAQSLWQNLPFGSKLTISTIVLVVFSVAVLTSISIIRERADFRSDLESQAELLLGALPITIRDPLYLLELDELVEISRVVGKNNEITNMQIINEEGISLIDTDRGGITFDQSPNDLGIKILQLDSNDIYFDWQDDQLISGKVIELGNRPIGAIVVGLSTNELNEELDLISRQSFFIALIILAIGGVSAYISGKHISTPLNELTDVAIGMAKGKMSLRVNLQNESEIGQLGRAFNNMADTIQERETELRNLAAGLEREVETRTKEYKEAKLEAEAAANFKTQLLANVSHDLRTPLNVILGYSEMLFSGSVGQLEAKEKELVGAIIRGAGQLLGFVNNLLDQAQIEAGKINVRVAPFSPRSLAENAYSVTSIIALAKGLTLMTEVDEDLPDPLQGDYQWIYQILYNLVTNAIKFTEEGTINVHLKNVDEINWAMEVSDTGIGIPAEAHEKIFESFWQMGMVNTTVKGSGLGLSIVRQLVDTLGGAIALESEAGKGSVFTVTLPKQLITNS